MRQIEYCEMDIATGSDPDVVAAARERIGTLMEVWDTALKERGEFDTGTPSSILDNLRDELAARHSVYDPDARRRLLRLLELAQDWVSVLATRGRSLRGAPPQAGT